MRKCFALRGYRWIVAGACFLMVLVTLGFCSGTKSLYLAPITEATGIRRSLFSLSDSCRFVTTAAINLFFGSLLARFGARRLIAAGFGCLILFALTLAYASSVIGFCLGGCFLGLGLSWTTTTMVGHAVNAWWPERRGTVMGVILAANGFGGALAAQIVSPMIYRDGDLYGYRAAYRLTALILIVCAVFVLAAFREYPQSTEASAEPKSEKPRTAVWRGIDLPTAIRTPYFYAASVGIFLTGMTLQAINGVAAAHMRDVGLDASFLAAIFSFYSLALAASKILMGVLYDRLGLRRTLLICECASVGAIILLILTAPTLLGKIAAAGYGFLCALAMPLETIMLPLITADLFGECAYEKLLGIMVSVNTAGYALGTPLTNLCYDLTGTYVPALCVLCAVMLGVTVLFSFVLRVASRRLAQNQL